MIYKKKKITLRIFFAFNHFCEVGGLAAQRPEILMLYKFRKELKNDS
jgi:hypothetical protein